MDRWIVLSKFFMVVYTVVIYINNSSANKIPLVVLSLLVYMALNTYIYIIENSRKIKIISTGILLLITVSFFVLDKSFIVLFPISFLEVLKLFNIPQGIGIYFLIIPLFKLNKDILNEYLIVATITYVVIRTYYLYTAKIQKLIEENDYLKEKNYLLNKHQFKDKEYNSQLKYVSQLEERNKIAQEIHDNIGHTISGSLLQLEAAKYIMDKDTEKAQKMIQNTINVMRKGMDDIRATLRNIKPPNEQIGINQLKLMLAEFEVNSGIKATFYYDGDLSKISKLYWKIIIDSLKEIFTNTIKYSKATEIKANIKVLNKIIRFQVNDNGVGFTQLVRGLGIKGIEERCENVHGKVIIDGSNGFSVILILPIK